MSSKKQWRIKLTVLIVTLLVIGMVIPAFGAPSGRGKPDNPGKPIRIEKPIVEVEEPVVGEDPIEEPAELEIETALAALDGYPDPCTPVGNRVVTTNPDADLFQGWNQPEPHPAQLSKPTGCTELIHFKVDANQNQIENGQTYTQGEFQVTIYKKKINEKWYFAFESNMPVYHVWAKGGPGGDKGGNLYSYPDGTTLDCGLSQPGGDWSHISFYYCRPIFGCLQVKKLFADYPTGYNLPNSIQVKIYGDVAGLTYPTTGHTITINKDSDGKYEWSNCSVIPGNYTVEEVPILGWTPMLNPTDGKVTVVAGGSAQAVLVTITNTFNYGCLQIKKLFAGYPAGYNLPNSIQVNIYGDVAGLTYPTTGQTITINKDADGKYEWSSCRLIPGNYTVEEVPIQGWTPTLNPVDGRVTVVAGGSAQAALVTITNTYIPPRCETAWADGTRYNNDKRGGNWATYTTYVPNSTVTLYAGQTEPVGTVHFSEVDSNKVTITINLNGWAFKDGEVVAIQDYTTPPRGNPAPGRFNHKFPASGSSWSGVVPANNFYGIHANVCSVVTITPPSTETYGLTMAVVGNGTATDLTNSGPYVAGTVVNIQAVADPGWVFLQWTTNPTNIGTFGNINDPVTTFTMPTSNLIVTAVFYNQGSSNFRNQTWTHTCGNWGAYTSGNTGTTVDTWDISAVTVGAVIDFMFDAYSYPDRFVIEYNGQVVHDTGWRGSDSYDGPLYPGGIAGPGYGQVDAVFTKIAGVNTFKVTVYAPQSGTAWNYQLRCRMP